MMATLMGYACLCQGLLAPVGRLSLAPLVGVNDRVVAAAGVVAVRGDV